MSRNKTRIKALVIILVILLFLVAACFVTIKFIFPLKYEDSIIKYSKEYELDPYYVCAVIWTESKFDSNAESRVGAIGLMQLMPETAVWIEKKIDDEKVKAKDALLPQAQWRQLRARPRRLRRTTLKI